MYLLQTTASKPLAPDPSPTCHAVDGGGLSRSIGPKKAEQLTLLNAKPGATNGPEIFGRHLHLQQAMHCLKLEQLAR
jgi:hypothetical protein